MDATKTRTSWPMSERPMPLSFVERSPEWWKKVRQRLARRSQPGLGGCLLWLGGRNSKGYGKIKLGGRYHLSHRLAYELEYGPVPVELTLDHLCLTRHCLNTKHLEAVTNRENILRGVGITAQRARQTHCIHGHALKGVNLIVQPPTASHGASRRCRTCRRDEWRRSSRKWYQAHRRLLT